MKIYGHTFTIWYDPHWWAGRYKSWQKRKWYFARVQVVIVNGKNSKPYAFQVGPLTFKFILEIIDNG